MAYNVKNYTEQGGEVTHIGGKLVFDEGARITGFPGAANMAADPPGSDSTYKVRVSLNALITALKNAGIMIPDEWNVGVKDATTASLHDMPTSNTLSNSNHASVTIDGTAITITLDCDVSDLKDCDHGSTWGTHKWLGFGVSTGLDSVVGVIFSDGISTVTLTSDDASEASSVGLSAGDFILYIKAEKLAGQGGAFTLNADGYGETEFTMEIVVDKDEQ